MNHDSKGFVDGVVSSMADTNGETYSLSYILWSNGYIIHWTAPGGLQGRYFLRDEDYIRYLEYIEKMETVTEFTKENMPYLLEYNETLGTWR